MLVLIVNYMRGDSINGLILNCVSDIKLCKSIWDSRLSRTRLTTTVESKFMQKFFLVVAYTNQVITHVFRISICLDVSFHGFDPYSMFVVLQRDVTF